MLLSQLAVMFGGPEDVSVFLLRHVAHEFGGAARPELALRDALAGGQERPRRQHRHALHHRAVHHAGLHSHKSVIFHRAGVEDGAVAHGHAVAHGRALKVAGRMDDGAVLNVCVFADPDIIDIAAQDAVVPDVAALPDLHVADDAGRRGDEGGLMDFRHDAAVGVDESAHNPTIHKAGAFPKTNTPANGGA